MGWMSPSVHLRLQVIIRIWSTASSCQFFFWRQIWPSENEAGAGCFSALNLAVCLFSVSCVLPIYCYSSEYQERRRRWTNCHPGASPGEVTEQVRGLEHMMKEEEAQGRSFCCPQYLVGCVEKMEPDSSWRCTGTGQEARDTTATKKFQLDMKNFFFSGGSCQPCEALANVNKWVTLGVISDPLRSPAGMPNWKYH